MHTVVYSACHSDVRHTNQTPVASPRGATLSIERTASANYSSQARCKSLIQLMRGSLIPSMAVAPLMLIVGFTAALKAVPGLPQHGADWSVSRLPMSTDPLPMTPLEITDHVVNLKRRQSRSMSSYFVQTLREQARAIQDGGDSRLSVGTNHNRHVLKTLTEFLLERLGQPGFGGSRPSLSRSHNNWWPKLRSRRRYRQQ